MVYGCAIARRTICAVALVSCATPSCARADAPTPAALVRANDGSGGSGVSPRMEDPDLESVAQRDPLGFLKFCLRSVERDVRDYRCTFMKKERLPTGMTEEQKIAVRYREDPFSVRMEWLEHAGRASVVTFVKGRWGSGGEQLANVIPSGIFGLLAPGGVKRDIHGKDMRKSSRRTIDQFGFRSSLELIIKYCELAADDPYYSLEYQGRAFRTGRECFRFERRLPYREAGGAWPDHLLRFYIDVEWLVPVAVFAYSDAAGERLLGSYISKDVELNVGLGDSDF